MFWYIGRVGKKASEDEVTGGRILEDNPKVVARLMRRRGTASHIVIDGLPIVKDSEIQNFAMHGTVGTGKSTLMRKKLLHLREAGVPVIIYDKGNTFVEEFYDESIDIILNPMDRRCANWDMWAECQTLPDLEAVTETLIPMGNSGDPFWQGSARTILLKVRSRCAAIKSERITASCAHCWRSSSTSCVTSWTERLLPRWLMAALRKRPSQSEVFSPTM